MAWQRRDDSGHLAGFKFMEHPPAVERSIARIIAALAAAADAARTH